MEIQSIHPTISKATVYRNLRQLAQSGLVNQLLLPDSVERYDGNICQHYHFKCKSCSGVFDVEIDYVVGIDDVVRQKYDCRVSGHDVVFTGVCPKCSLKGK